jgi:hypothetical protein
MKLQVWWVPQMPMKAFTVDVASVAEGVKLLNTLAKYDLFQYENKVKPDYSNAGGLNVWDAESREWTSWYDEKTGEDDPAEWLALQDQEDTRG